MNNGKSTEIAPVNSRSSVWLVGCKRQTWKLTAGGYRTSKEVVINRVLFVERPHKTVLGAVGRVLSARGS